LIQRSNQRGLVVDSAIQRGRQVHSPISAEQTASRETSYAAVRVLTIRQLSLIA
jgi:hypothetical protein